MPTANTKSKYVWHTRERQVISQLFLYFSQLLKFGGRLFQILLWEQGNRLLYRYIMIFWSFFINLPADGSITNIRQRSDDLCMHRENMICFVSNIWFCGVYSNAIKLLTISLIRKHHQNYSKNMRSNFFRNEKICRTIFWIYTVCIYVLYSVHI